MQNNDWLSRYELEQHKYESLAAKICRILSDVLTKEGIYADYESRVKTVESFSRKASQSDKGYVDPLAQITDLAGIRVVVRSLADVRKVERTIECEFEIDKYRSADKKFNLDVDRFGYLSSHYVVKLNEKHSKSPEWDTLKDLWAEIQLRTSLQHAWATISHFLDYKNNADVPKHLRRRLFRVSALLEIADEELDYLSREIAGNSAQYRAELIRGHLDIELNVDSLRAYIETSSEVRYWNQYLRDSLRVSVETWGDLSRDVRLAGFVGISSIKELAHLLHSVRGWGEQFLTEYYSEFFRRNSLQPEQVSVVWNGIVTMLIICKHFALFTPAQLDTLFGFGSPYILNAARKTRSEP